jgi:glucuronate isomerase
MSLELRRRLYAELDQLVLVDPHTHINPLDPGSHTLADILGYHYYTELAHSAGMPKSELERQDPVDKAQAILQFLLRCRNTVQVQWLEEIARDYLGFTGHGLSPEDAPSLTEAARTRMAKPDWTENVWNQSNLDALFLTNDFDDPLTGFDTKRFVPCLRTDDLVFKLHQRSVQDRVEAATGLDWHHATDVLDALFTHFKSHGARACAISLPPDFEPTRPSEAEWRNAIDRIATQPDEAAKNVAARGIFFQLADRCEEHSLPFDLMIGVRRGVYETGVFQGQDLFDQRTSLYQYRRLFNDKLRVTFCVSVLTHMQNQELVSYSWIFPNVVTSGHWWYSNIPAYIEADLRARLEAAPMSKQLGYYSDAYKLEFILPKFRMYRRCLARVLAAEFVLARGWPEERAVDLAHQILRKNVEDIFYQA